MSDHGDVLESVLAAWADDIREHCPERVAAAFAGDAVFQGFDPGHTVGRPAIVAYVTASAAGTHRMTFTYTSADPRSVRITVNGTVVGTENLPDSGGWEFLNKWSVDVPLAAGSNTIRFDNPSAFAPDIDALTIERATEAEASGNTRAGGAAVASCSGCSGGSAVTGLSGSGTLDVPGLTVAAAGNHTVRLDYASATAQTVQLQVNGGAAITVNLPATGSATAVATRTLGLPLTTGANTVRLKSASSATVAIDRLAVVR